MKIEKKAWPEMFQKVLDGEKKFDLRLADFKCQPGDALILREWDPRKKKYTGRVLEREVSYVMKTKDLKFWPKNDIEKYGLQVISLK